MTDASSEARDTDVPGACVRVGEQAIEVRFGLGLGFGLGLAS